MQTKLYVGNLSYNVSEDGLRQLFSQAGEVKEVALITDRYTRRPKGFGFVEMVNQVDAEKAIRMFHDQEFDGRRLIVNVARPREERGRSDDRGSFREGGRPRY